MHSLEWPRLGQIQRHLYGPGLLHASHSILQSVPTNALLYIHITDEYPQYLGLHPFVFKNSASKALGYVQTAQDVANAFRSFSTSSGGASATAKAPAAAISASPSTAAAATAGSSWTKWAVPAAYGLGGLLLSGAAAGAAYYKRDDLGMGYKWATDHMKYVGTLWEEEKLRKRLDDLLMIERDLGVAFRE